MSTSICTLFENHYHYGLAAFINSAYSKGFKGDIYVGYRGDLPRWVNTLQIDKIDNYQNVLKYKVGEDIHLFFLQIETDYHFANYKPTFMLELFEGLAAKSDAIAYFDPDIVLKCNWAFFDSWISHGVAMVHEITSNDMPPNHPIRREWEKLITLNNRKTVRQLYSYINSGFCGVKIEHIAFIEIWKEMIETGIKYYNHSSKSFFTSDRTDPFYVIDQDAFNIAAMCSETPLSEMGPEAMDFVYGGQIMSHAISNPKPWKKKYFLSALKGNPISITDRAFWNNMIGPIKPYGAFYLWKKKKVIFLASIITRFNKK